MKRTARIWMALPIAALYWGLATFGCKGGGGSLDGIDGSTSGDGSTAGQGSSSGIGDAGATGNGDACATAIVTIDDNAASENASSGGPGCTEDSECAVRLEGDYCSCPSTPRPILTSRTAAFDEGLNGIGARCTCAIPPCEPPPRSKAGCRDGRCVLVDAGE